MDSPSSGWRPRKYAQDIIDWVSNSIAAQRYYRRETKSASQRTRTVPVDVFEKQAARLAVEGAMRPADLEQGTDGPPGTGPTVRTRPRHRWQSQTAGTRSVTPFCHSVFVLWSSIKGEPNCLAGQPLKIYRRDLSFESLFLSLVSFFLSPFLLFCHVRVYAHTHEAKAVLYIRRIGISDNTMEFHTR